MRCHEVAAQELIRDVLGRLDLYAVRLSLHPRARGHTETLLPGVAATGITNLARVSDDPAAQ